MLDLLQAPSTSSFSGPRRSSRRSIGTSLPQGSEGGGGGGRASMLSTFEPPSLLLLLTHNVHRLVLSDKCIRIHP